MKKLVLPTKKCKNCSKEFGRESCKRVFDYKVKVFCSRECYVKFSVGKNHHNWKRGFRTRPDGYLRNSKDEYFHRLVMEQHIGRKLTTTEHIHHIDGNPKNNDISNLLIVSNSQHRKIENLYAKRDEYGKYCKK